MVNINGKLSDVCYLEQLFLFQNLLCLIIILNNSLVPIKNQKWKKYLLYKSLVEIIYSYIIY